MVRRVPLLAKPRHDGLIALHVLNALHQAVSITKDVLNPAEAIPNKIPGPHDCD
jgi:hypothetical protein